jgi:lipopolysaccharide transport system permease protein
MSEWRSAPGARPHADKKTTNDQYREFMSSQIDTQIDSPEIDPNHIHIEPSSTWLKVPLKDLWRYRELLYFLTWRDIKIRYRQTALGAAWAVLQPFLTMVVFSIFFGRLGNIPSDGIPYPIFSYAALLPWQYFQSSLAISANSLVGNANLITKVYFPRLIIPISATFSGLVDFAIAFSILILLMIYFQIQPTLGVLLLPVFLLLALITALGVSLWLSALNVKYRDVRYVVPFLTQFWFFATPVAYPSSMLDEPWRTLYGLNPMVGVVEGFRWALLDSNPPGPMLILSAVISILLLISGLLYFNRMEKTFADVI